MLSASEPAGSIWQDRLRTLLPDDPEEGDKEQQEKEALSVPELKMDPI